MNCEVRVLADEAALVRAAADIVLAVGRPAVDAVEPLGPGRQRTIALSGGRTPAALFRHLGRERPDLRSAREQDRDAGDVQAYGPPFLYAHIFWSDERCVSPGHERSNFGLARREMLEPLGFGEEQMHRLAGESEDPAAAAAAYETEIHRTFAKIWEAQYRIEVVTKATGLMKKTPPPDPDEWERFDLILLGLGADGHVASLFPEVPALAEERRWVVETIAPDTHEPRLSMSLVCINRARQVLFLVQGADKAEAVRRVLEPKPGEAALPASLVRPDQGVVTWLLDAEAGSCLAQAKS